MPKLDQDGNIVWKLSEIQQQDAEALIRQYLAGLGSLEIIDFGYAYVARLIAVANGEDLPTVLAIDDRDSAQAYITGLDEWDALPAAVRQWLAIDLESRAYDAMAIRLLVVNDE